MGTRSNFNEILFFVIVACSLTFSFAQELPKKIDGYKVHSEIIRISNDEDQAKARAKIIVCEPTVSDISLSGITLNIAGELQEAGLDGQIEHLKFRDFSVNGISVAVEPINVSFILKKEGTTSLPVPATVFLSTPNILNAAWKEATASSGKWDVAGRVFVFGRFKKFGFSFKRVVPVDVRLTMPNPLAQLQKDFAF